MVKDLPNKTVGERLGEISQWQIDHTKEDKDVHMEHLARFDVMESQINALPTTQDIERVVRKTMLDVLFSTGRGTKAVILTGAALIVALGIITGGFWKALAFFSLGIIK